VPDPGGNTGRRLVLCDELPIVCTVVRATLRGEKFFAPSRQRAKASPGAHAAIFLFVYVFFYQSVCDNVWRTLLLLQNSPKIFFRCRTMIVQDRERFMRATNNVDVKSYALPNRPRIAGGQCVLIA